jgi:hypothetical protein
VGEASVDALDAVDPLEEEKSPESSSVDAELSLASEEPSSRDVVDVPRVTAGVDAADVPVDGDALPPFVRDGSTTGSAVASASAQRPSASRVPSVVVHAVPPAVTAWMHAAATVGALSVSVSQHATSVWQSGADASVSVTSGALSNAQPGPAERRRKSTPAATPRTGRACRAAGIAEASWRLPQKPSRERPMPSFRGARRRVA